MSSTSVKQYIEITEAGLSATGKTKVWRVRNKRTAEEIGTLKWYGGFRKYCFFPILTGFDWLLFDADCLRMIADFLDEQNAIRKKRP